MVALGRPMRRDLLQQGRRARLHLFELTGR
jgi:hypothetical protein